MRISRMEASMTKDSSKSRKTLIDAELWPDDDTDIWDAAWFYALRLNWAVMPVENGGKKPVLSGWQKLTHDDSLQNIGSSNGSAHSWRREFPRANLGLVCGPASGVAVIDIDNKTDPDTGESGPDQWRTLCQSLVDRPPWVTCARTPTGGMHVFFSSASLPFGSKNGQIATKIDFKAGAPDGTGVGQVVIAPSRREINGVVRHYGWVTRINSTVSRTT